jgi:inosine-uridine nucleoside N-ribohydrolase
MTVVDSRLKAAGEPNVDVAVEVDAQRFVSEFMEALRWWVQEKGGQGP